MAADLRQARGRRGARDGYWCATLGRDPKNRAAPGCGKDDSAGAIPTCPASIIGVRDDLHRSTVSGYSFELAVGKKTEVASIGRPERKVTTAGSGDLMRLGRTERPPPDRARVASHDRR